MRAHIAMDPASAPRPSAKVATVAGLLGCHPSDVRRLVSHGQLQAHGIGKRGVRIYLDSVRDYQDRQTKVPAHPNGQVINRPKRPSQASSASFRAAMAGLAAKGLR